MAVRAKFQCTHVGRSMYGHEIRLTPVTSGSAENESFFKYTPGGEIHLTVLNDAAVAQFEVGSEYYVYFRLAEL